LTSDDDLWLGRVEV